MVEDLSERLVRIETKVDMLIENHKTANSQREKLEQRVEEIERRLNLFGGALIAVNFLVVFFADKIRNIFS
jgi:predicted nuclease with TOPRIM domain